MSERSPRSEVGILPDDGNLIDVMDGIRAQLSDLAECLPAGEIKELIRDAQNYIGMAEDLFEAEYLDD